MRKRVLGSAILLALAQGGSNLTARAADPVRCCFTNPQFAGVCAVEPGEGESCATVLEYLNDPQSQGKNYCGNTSIRGGWTQKGCAPAR
jgi:hypothetical protein